MEKEKILEWGDSLLKDIPAHSSGFISEIKEIIRNYSGKNNSYYEEIDKIETTWSTASAKHYAYGVLKSFIKAIKNDYIGGLSYERKIKQFVVNEFLEQAEILLNTDNVHPAASVSIAGAALEEFLRNWVEDENIDLSGQKPCIDTYAKVLRTNDIISKQDLKEITAWAGIRNDAAHGKWDLVNDKKRILIFIEGINLFINKKLSA